MRLVDEPGVAELRRAARVAGRRPSRSRAGQPTVVTTGALTVRIGERRRSGSRSAARTAACCCARAARRAGAAAPARRPGAGGLGTATTSEGGAHAPAGRGLARPGRRAALLRARPGRPPVRPAGRRAPALELATSATGRARTPASRCWSRNRGYGLFFDNTCDARLTVGRSDGGLPDRLRRPRTGRSTSTSWSAPSVRERHGRGRRAARAGAAAADAGRSATCSRPATSTTPTSCAGCRATLREKTDPLRRADLPLDLRRRAGLEPRGRPPRVPAGAVARPGRDCSAEMRAAALRADHARVPGRCTRSRRSTPRRTSGATCWPRATPRIVADRRTRTPTSCTASATSTSRARRRARWWWGQHRPLRRARGGRLVARRRRGAARDRAAARRRRRAAAQRLRPLPLPGVLRGRGGRPAGPARRSCSAAPARPACSATAAGCWSGDINNAFATFETQVPLGPEHGDVGRAVLGHRHRRVLPPGAGEPGAVRALVPVRRVLPALPRPRLGLARARALGARPRGRGDLPRTTSSCATGCCPTPTRWPGRRTATGCR